MSLSGCQINPIDVSFHLQKSLEIFGKNSDDKFWLKKDRGWKVPLGLRDVGGQKSQKLVFVNGPLFWQFLCKMWKQIELLLQKKLHPIMDSSEQSQEFRSLSMGKRHIPAKIRLCRLHKYVFLVIHQKECKTRIFLSHLLSLYLAMLKSKDAIFH